MDPYDYIQQLEDERDALREGLESILGCSEYMGHEIAHETLEDNPRTPRPVLTTLEPQ